MLCQLPDTFNGQGAALFCFDVSPDDTRWVAYDKKNRPLMAFGCSPSSNPTLWSAWAFGVKGAEKAVPAVTRFVMTKAVPYVRRKYRPKRLEIRALSNYTEIHDWLSKGLGLRKDADLWSYGKNGEDFTLFSWTEDNISIIYQRWLRRVRRTTRANTETPANEGLRADVPSETA